MVGARTVELTARRDGACGSGGSVAELDAFRQTAVERELARDQLVASQPFVTADKLERSDAGRSSRMDAERERGLVTVVHDGVVLVPAFQLDEALTLRAEVAEINARLTPAGMNGWATWAWWTGRRAALGTSPIDALNAGRAGEVVGAVDRLLDPQG